LLVLGATALAATVVAVPVALASDLFTDVPDANPFHNDIGAIARAGITQGKTCVPPGTPPTYCPGENVTREAMAAFMHRGFGRVAEASDSVEAFNSPTDVSLGTITLTPGLPAAALAGAGAFIKLDFNVNLVANNTSGCPCVFWFELADPAEATVGNPGGFIGEWYIGGTISSAIPEMTIPVTAAYFVTGTAARTIHLTSHLESGTGTADIFWQATASYFPFGSTGTNVLRESGQGKAELRGKAAARAPGN
jgi:hypothetical protein